MESERKEKNMKRIYSISVITAVLSFIAAMALEVYAFFAYTDSFFTTSKNFVHLEVANPLLYKVSIICIIVTVISGTIAYLIRSIYRKRKHR